MIKQKGENHCSRLNPKLLSPNPNVRIKGMACREASSRNRRANKIIRTQLPLCVSVVKVQHMVGKPQAATNSCCSFRGCGLFGTN